MGNSYLFLSVVSLLLGLLTGHLLYRADFCLAGAFRDLFLFKRTVMLKNLVLLIASTMVLFEGARLLGLLPLYPFPLLYSPTPANFLGGLLFGLGMVLAGGCVVGTLYKMGSGKVLSAVAFLGLVAGSALYAEIHPRWAAFIKATTFLKGRITVPQILGLSSPTLPVLLVAATALYLAWRWYGAGTLERKSYAEGHLQPWKAALALSVISTLSYVFLGMPLGVTSSYAKIAGYLEKAFLPGHLEGLAYFKAVPLKYIQPVTGEELTGGGGPVFDAIAAIQFPLVGGIILGSALSAYLVKEFHIIFRAPARQYASALLGGLILGLASRMAPTCNVWHLMGGVPILAASSLLFLAGLLPGAWVGGILLTGYVAKEKV